MKYNPLFFSGESVCAILEGRKTQTRRVIKQQPHRTALSAAHVALHGWEWCFGEFEQRVQFSCPYGQRGDRLWAKETCFIDRDVVPMVGTRRAFFPGSDTVRMENGSTGIAPYVPTIEMLSDNTALKKYSIFMPRWASRITLEIIGVRVERLQIITDADARAEGITVDAVDRLASRQIPELAGATPAISAYRKLWNTLNANRGYGWDINPWVWVLEFKRVQA